MRLRLLIAVGGSVVLLASCTGEVKGFGDPGRRVEPSLTAAPNVRIDVDSRDATRDGGFIMQAGLVGRLRVNPQGCLYAYVPSSPRSGGREFRTDLVWPRGTTVALDDGGTPVVVRYDGVVIAEVGHSLRGLGGGSVAARPASHIVCRVKDKGHLLYIQGDMPPLLDGG